MIYTYDELKSKPTICQGHSADLKVDTGTLRIWVSRCTIADGELDPVQVEVLKDGRWIDATRGPDSVYVCQGQGARAGVRADGVWFRDARGTARR